VIALPDSTRWYRLATIEPSKRWLNTPVSSALLLNGRSSGTIRGLLSSALQGSMGGHALIANATIELSIAIESY
jgi:hypothetical protein